jgi:hypothetical protein
MYFCKRLYDLGFHRFGRCFVQKLMQSLCQSDIAFSVSVLRLEFQMAFSLLLAIFALAPDLLYGVAGLERFGTQMP